MSARRGTWCSSLTLTTPPSLLTITSRTLSTTHLPIMRSTAARRRRF
jgi:hypothetical protein